MAASSRIITSQKQPKGRGFSGSPALSLSLLCHLQLQDTAVISSIFCSHHHIQWWKEMFQDPHLGYPGQGWHTWACLALPAKEASGQRATTLGACVTSGRTSQTIPASGQFTFYRCDQPKTWGLVEEKEPEGRSYLELASRPLQLRGQQITNFNSRNSGGGQGQRHVKRKSHDLLTLSVKQRRREWCFSAGAQDKRQRPMSVSQEKSCRTTIGHLLFGFFKCLIY